MLTCLLRRTRGLGCALLLFSAVPAAAQDAPAAESTTTQDGPIGEAPEERDAGDIFLRGQRVLLARGNVVLDVGQFYSRSDTLQLAIAGSTLQLATQERSLLTTALFGRVGVLNETEVYAGGAFHHLENRLVAGTSDLASSGRNLAGDVGLGVRRTLLREGVGRPDIIASLDTQIPSRDESAYVVGAGLVVVKSIDPVVLFAGSTYRHAMRRGRADGTSLPPGDAFGVTLGYGLAINDTIAISTAASGVFTDDRVTEDVTTGRAETFVLRFALTSALARRLYVEPSVSIGLSGPGQSFTMGVTIPYAF
jgi:hypothetical protein